MKLNNILATALFAGVSTLGFAQAIETAPSGYSLRWSDEFNGTELNEKNWNYETGNGNWGFGNGEREYYRKENVSVVDGKLVITAKKEDFQGFKFTSGRINGNNKVYFKHGVIQAKIKFPKTADGLWPAYWMMGNDINRYGWPKCGEMDIVEMGFSKGIETGWQDRYFGGTLHWGPNNAGHQFASQDFESANNNYTNDYSKWPAVEDGEWHVVTVDWDSEKCRMYLDLEGWNNPRRNRAVFASFDIPASDDPFAVGTYFHKPFYFLFNVAVGGTYTGLMNDGDITCFNDGDKAMEVDWVRVYQKDGDETAEYYYTDEDGNVQTNIKAEEEPDPTPDNTTELSGFATKALDAEGKTTFDFNDVSDAVLISTSEGVTGNLYSAGANVVDYNVNNTNRNLYIWDNTYVNINRNGEVNSFGWEEGYSKFVVGNVGWSGLGFNINGEDLSMIDDTYWLHFAMRGTDQDMHTSHSVTVSKANFRVGNSDGKLASVGDFKRDGEWYYFDIPVKALEQFAGKGKVFGDNPKNFNDNIIAFMSGGITDAEISYDNIFFYKSKSKEIPTFTDTKADLGQYGYKSLDKDGNPVKTFTTDNVKVMAPLALDNTSREIYTGNGNYTETDVVSDKKYDYSLDNNYYIWKNTMWTENKEGIVNTLGLDTEPFAYWHDNDNLGWNGYGIIGQTAKDFSMIDDTYFLHIDLMSQDAVAHIPVTVGIGNSQITFGSYSDGPVFADFGRDGEWYSFDIPVSVLKRYGSLFENVAGKPKETKNAWMENFLTFSTGGTQYYGAGFAFDNVFFWQPVDQSELPEVSELGDYTTKSLDENGKSYFDFADKDFFPITAGEAEKALMGEDNILADFSVDDDKVHLYYWEGTYEAGSETGKNSFGFNEGWIDAVVTNKGWSGMGITAGDEGFDLSQLSDKAYFHFAMRATSDAYDFHLILGKAHFTIGKYGYTNNYGEKYPVLGNLKRDGEWYSFDIPLAEFKKINANLWDGKQAKFNDNIFCAEVGSTPGNEIQIDNMFFWQDKAATGISKPATATGINNANIGIFDITGRKVQNMDRPGLYIIRTADGVKKVLKK